MYSLQSVKKKIQKISKNILQLRGSKSKLTSSLFILKIRRAKQSENYQSAERISF